MEQPVDMVNSNDTPNNLVAPITGTNSNNKNLFVYGTLRPDTKAITPIKDYLARHTKVIGNGTIWGKLHKINWFVGAIEGSSPNLVRGILLEVDNRLLDEVYNTLDQYENVSSGLFYKKDVSVYLDAGTEAIASVYFFNKDKYPEAINIGTLIPSGDYLQA